jgi:hypothetical protein
LLWLDRERVGRHELVEPRPERQAVAQAEVQRPEQVALTVDELRRDGPCPSSAAGQLVGRADGDDDVAADGGEARLDDPPLVVDGDGGHHSAVARSS